MGCQHRFIATCGKRIWISDGGMEGCTEVLNKDALWRVGRLGALHDNSCVWQQLSCLIRRAIDTTQPRPQSHSLKGLSSILYSKTLDKKQFKKYKKFIGKT